MVKAVEDIDSRLADSAGGEQVFNHMMAEQQHELLRVERGNRFKAAVGGPDAPAGNSMDVGMEIQAISITLHRNNNARQCGMVGGGFLEHLLERLPGCFTEQAEVFGVVFENSAQKLGDGENKL
jgi:hypothetical protein